MDVYTTLSDYLNRARYLEITEEDHQLDVVKQHRELLNAIIRKDKVKVNRIFLRHVDREQVDCVLMNHYAQYFTD